MITLPRKHLVAHLRAARPIRGSGLDAGRRAGQWERDVEAFAFAAFEVDSKEYNDLLHDIAPDVWLSDAESKATNR